MKILMVCLGNICRSPIAEGVLQHKAIARNLNWEVESAGTLSFHEGHAPHPLSQKTTLLHGIDISQQKSRPFEPEDFDRYDLIFAMAKDVVEGIQQIAGSRFEEKKVRLLMEELYPGEQLDVPDPYNGPEHEYHEVFSLIEKACEAFLQKQQSSR